MESEKSYQCWRRSTEHLGDWGRIVSVWSVIGGDDAIGSDRVQLTDGEDHFVGFGCRQQRSDGKLLGWMVGYVERDSEVRWNSEPNPTKGHKFSRRADQRANQSIKANMYLPQTPADSYPIQLIIKLKSQHIQIHYEFT